MPLAPFTRLRHAVLALLLAASGAGASAQQRLVLTSGAEWPWSAPDGRGFLNLVVRDAFARVGKVAEVQVLTSSERGLINADQGVDDGVAMRIAGLEKLYPNLIRIEEPVAVNDFVALSAKPVAPAVDWAMLKSHSIGFVNGWKVFEARLVEGPLVAKVRDADQLFSLMAQGRVDIGLYERWQGMHKARSHGLAVTALEPPLVRATMHIYVHQRHAALAPQLSQALAAMKRDGSYDRHWNATIGALQSTAPGPRRP